MYRRHRSNGRKKRRTSQFDKFHGHFLKFMIYTFVFYCSFFLLVGSGNKSEWLQENRAKNGHWRNADLVGYKLINKAAQWGREDASWPSNCNRTTLDIDGDIREARALWHRSDYRSKRKEHHRKNKKSLILTG